jgi:hypothetical protein
MSYTTIVTKKNTAPLLIVLAAFLWSLDGLLRRELYHLPPLTIVFLEHIFGLLILLPIFFRSHIDIRTLSRREWIAIITVSLFSGLLGVLIPKHYHFPKLTPESRLALHLKFPMLQLILLFAYFAFLLAIDIKSLIRNTSPLPIRLSLRAGSNPPPQGEGMKTSAVS